MGVVNVGESVSYLADLLDQTAKIWGNFSRKYDFGGIFNVDDPLKLEGETSKQLECQSNNCSDSDEWTEFNPEFVIITCLCVFHYLEFYIFSTPLTLTCLDSQSSTCKTMCDV